MPPPSPSPRSITKGKVVIQQKTQPPNGTPTTSPGSSGSLSNKAKKANNNARLIAQLKSDLVKLQTRCEELEQECSYNAAKVHELTEIINKAKTLNDSNPENIQQALMEKSVEVAEISLQLERCKTEKSNILKQRNNDREMIQELNKVIKSLSCVRPNYNSGTDDDEENGGNASDINSDDDMDNDDDDYEFDENNPITAEKALQLTLKNMKFQVEIMEEERQNLAVKCKSQSGVIKQLQSDAELQTIKIDMLTQLAQQDTVSLVERLRQELEMKDLKIEMLEQLVKANAICGGLGSSIPNTTNDTSQQSQPPPTPRRVAAAVGNANSHDEDDDIVDDDGGGYDDLGDGLAFPSTPDGIVPTNTFSFENAPIIDEEPDSPRTLKKKKRMERRKRRDEELGIIGGASASASASATPGGGGAGMLSFHSVRSTDSTDSAPQLTTPPSARKPTATVKLSSSHESSRNRRASSSRAVASSSAADSNGSGVRGGGDDDKAKKKKKSSMTRTNSEPDLEKAKRVMQRRRERKAAEQRQQQQEQQLEEHDEMQEEEDAPKSTEEVGATTTPQSPSPLPSPSSGKESKNHHKQQKRKSKTIILDASSADIKLIVNGRKATYKGGTSDEHGGLPHGTGTLRFDNGDTYLGEMKYGDMHGKGTMYYSSRDKGMKRGYFKYNKYVGSELPSPKPTS